MSVHERVARLLDLYFTQRRQLLDERRPIVGWTTRISPADAGALRYDYKQRNEQDVEPFPFSEPFQVYMFGSTWLVDASVPVGEVRIDAPEVIRG